MLKKLIKYEFKATSRFMLLMYGLLIALSVIMSIGLRFNLDEVFEGIAKEFQLGALILGMFMFIIVTIFVVLNVTVICGMFFYAIKRFKDNILGDEGYLMHTLPVKTHQHITSKTIVSVIWTIVSFVAVMISTFILFLGISETNIFREVAYIFSQIQWGEFYVMEALIILVEFAICIVVTLINTYLHIYASMAIGFSSNTHRIAKSIGVYVAITIASNMFETIVLSPVLLFGIGGVNYMSNPHIILWGGTIIGAITAAVYYFITHYFLNKKLNLL